MLDGNGRESAGMTPTARGLVTLLVGVRKARLRFPLHDNPLDKVSGGESGIRTRDTVAGIHAFQACAFDRSAISPLAAETSHQGR